MKLSEVIAHLEQLAPPQLAESWDNTGLLLGDPAADVHKILTCLTLTPDVAEEAVATGVQLVVTHHPLMFKPVQRLTTQSHEGRTIWALAQAGIAVYSPHTAWDSAPEGINQQLAERFQLADIAPIRPQPQAAHYKLITTVPTTDLEPVQQALWNVGCGVIGDYWNCSFYSPGTGTFLGTASSQPTIGQAGYLEHVAEVKLEVVCPRDRLSAAVTALREAHSYEEPAIDVIPIEPLPGKLGAGRCGRLPAPMSLQEFAREVRQQLAAPGLQYVGDPTLPIERVGFACGAAAEFWRDARRAGCQVLVTGETRFHTALEVRHAGFAMIVAGHDATERFSLASLATHLSDRCPGVTANASGVEEDPLQSVLG